MVQTDESKEVYFFFCLRIRVLYVVESCVRRCITEISDTICMSPNH